MDKIQSLQCNIYYKRDLHAKCYVNENVALITSMNLHTYSEANNREFGILLSKQQDEIAYEECIQEVISIINNSYIEKEMLYIPNIEIKQSYYEYDDFITAWKRCLMKNSNIQFKIGDNDLVVYAHNYPVNDIDFSITYGFATFSLNGNYADLNKLREKEKNKLIKKLKGYRLYWNTSHKICLYESKNEIFENIDDNITYCEKGLDILINELKRIFS